MPGVRDAVSAASVLQVCCRCVAGLLRSVAPLCVFCECLPVMEILPSVRDNENALQHTATHCRLSTCANRHCTTLHHITTHCNTLQHTSPHYNTIQHTATHFTTLQHTATHCNILYHITTHCNTLQRIQPVPEILPLAVKMRTYLLQHTASHCNTLQRTATHCNSNVYL